jgi:hypothetical protein
VRHIERIFRPSRDVFFREFVRENKPVILAGMMTEWPAMTLWRRDYLKEVFGGADIEVMGGRDGDMRYEPNCEQHRRMMPATMYIDLAFDGAGNDAYMVANNKVMATTAGRTLVGDVVQWPDFLNTLHPCHAGGNIFLWFGPKGTVTPLHHDTLDIMLCQVIGAKRVAMISPDQKPYLYNSVGVFSDVDYEAPDFPNYPMFAAVEAVEFTLMAGDVLFIPVNWWHHVRSLSVSISVSFTNLLKL